MKKKTKQQLEEEMYNKYPWVFSGRNEPITRSLMGFGCEVGVGWIRLISILASCYEGSMKSNWRQYPLVRFVQIKEKFGGLRAYIECVPMTEEQFKQRWLAYEQTRREKWYPNEKDRWEEYDSKEYQEYLVDAAKGADTFHAWESMVEDISFHICEDCGTMDDVTTGGKGWISTLCTRCRKARESQKAWWRWNALKWSVKYWFKWTLPEILDSFKRKEKPKDEEDNSGGPSTGNQ
jgi:hypothetical protein